MAIIRVDSTASGANNGTSWTDAYQTFQAALTAWTTADEIWIRDVSNEISASVTLTAPNSNQFDLVPIYRMTNTDVYAPSPQDQTDTIQIDTTGTTGSFNLNFYGAFHGVRLRSARWLNITAENVMEFYDSDIEFGAGNGLAYLSLFSTRKTHFHSTTIRANGDGATNDNYIRVEDARNVLFNACLFPVFRNSSTGLFDTGDGNRPTRIKVVDSDLSNISNNNLVRTARFSTGSTNRRHEVTFDRCDLKLGYTLSDGTMDVEDAIVQAIRCRTSASDNINEKQLWNGKVDEDTVTYHDNGFVEAITAVGVSQRLAPEIDVEIVNPLESFEIVGILASSGTKTFTIEMVENFTTALTKRECWAEFAYPDSSSTARRTRDTSTKEFAKVSYTNLPAGTGLGNWTGEPAGSRSVKIELTATVNRVGLVKAKVFLGKYEAGKVLQVDPLMGIT